LEITSSAKNEIKKIMELDTSMKYLVTCVWSKPQPDLRRNSEGKAEWGMYGEEGWRVAVVPSLGFDESRIQVFDGINFYIGKDLKVEKLDFSNDVWLVNGEAAIPYERIDL
jgi:hypothetical protein